MQTISVIIPAREEGSTIGEIIDEIKSAIAGIERYSFELIAVVDSPLDKGALIAEQKGTLVCVSGAGYGKGNAIISASKICRGEVVIIIDADGSHAPADLPIFIEAAEAGAGLVIGSRILGGSDDWSSLRMLGNICLSLLAGIFFKTKFCDVLNGYKALKKDIFLQHTFISKGFEIEIELVYAAIENNYALCEIPSHERKRRGGVKKSRTLTDGLRILMAIVRWGLRYRARLWSIGRKTR
jgi:glycosyltransferase involved in cell wall biosynthesis